MQISSVDISFNDPIYQETGIHKNSVALREVQVRNGKGQTYAVQVIKKNLNNQETIFIALKNSLGRVIEDAVVGFGMMKYHMDKRNSQDSIVIDDLEEGSAELTMQLNSDSADLHVKLQIEIEKDRIVPQKTAKKKNAEAIETEKKKKDDKL